MKNSKKNQKVLKVPSREEQIKKYQNISPSQIFYNPNTIKWFKKKYNENLIKKSIYSLFPNNCEPVMSKEEKEKFERQIQGFLSKYMKQNDKYEHTWINPKYFFSKEVYESILKLKEIFLQFDEDGSRKMEIDEMTTMFNTNNINVTEDDLCGLFFKGKKYRKKDINILYLDFFQFMKFALSKESDQEFRVFMRNIKEKKMKEKEEERKAEEEKKKKNLENLKGEEEEVVDDLFVDEKKEPVFFPMNFNLLLDYFINKGKERKSQKKIRRAIKMMRNILTPGRYPPDDPDFQKDEGEEEEEQEDEKKENEKEEKKEKEEEERINYDKQLKEINTMKIMEEFDKLFKMSYISPTSSLKTQPKNKVITSKVAEATKSNSSFRKTFFREKTMAPPNKKEKLDISEKAESKKDIHIDINDEDNNNNNSNYLDSPEIKRKRTDKRMNTYKIPVDMNILKSNLIGEDEENSKINKIKINNIKLNKSKKKEKRCMFFTDIIKKEIEQPNIEDMNLFYFNKYHSVYLAKKATEKRVMDYYNRKQSEIKKGKTVLPIIKDKNKIKIVENNKKAESVKKNEYKRLMDSFGFTRKKYKNQFLY